MDAPQHHDSEREMAREGCVLGGAHDDSLIDAILGPAVNFVSGRDLPKLSPEVGITIEYDADGKLRRFVMGGRAMLMVAGLAVTFLAFVIAVRLLFPTDWKAILAFVSGIMYVGVILSMAVFVPKPTPFAYFVLRTVLALGAAGFGAVLVGTLSVNIGGWLEAAGGFALFAVVYLIAPAILRKTLEDKK